VYQQPLSTDRLPTIHCADEVNPPLLLETNAARGPELKSAGPGTGYHPWMFQFATPPAPH
jgi:hypothetical protein